MVRFADQEAAIAVAIEVNGVDARRQSCGAGCTEYGAGTAAPVMTWIHAGAHVLSARDQRADVSCLPRTLPFALIVADSDRPATRIDSTTQIRCTTGEVPASSPTWHARIFGALPSRCGPFGWAGSAGSRKPVGCCHALRTTLRSPLSAAVLRPDWCGQLVTERSGSSRSIQMRRSRRFASVRHQTIGFMNSLVSQVPKRYNT